MTKYKEARYRSVIKALTWRVIATLITMLIVFAFTDKLALSLGVGFVEVVVKIIAYYLHERVWVRIKFGVNNQALPIS